MRIRIRTAFGSLLIFLSASVAADNQPKPMDTEEIMGLVQQYCGSCHAVPSPALLPKHSWPHVIDAMVELARNQTGTEFIPPEHVPHIKALYYGSSPTALPRLPYVDNEHPSISFTATPIGAPSELPQVAHIQPVDFGRGGRSFLVSDGETGKVTLLEAQKGNNDQVPKWQETPLAKLTFPVSTQAMDFNGNGRLDVLVADLGVLPPVEALAGKVFVLEQEESGQFTQRLIIDGLGRVSDARAVDINNNGRLDLAVAVFGGGQVGEVFWLENLGDGSYKKNTLLRLSGALNLIPADLNGNGKMDLVTLIAQEYEEIIAFINQGDGTFEQMSIANAGHPIFGMTSMKVADLNQNGRPDLIFTNGDAFDTQNDPKPYHGVQWLENLGDLQFAYHDIGRFYGAANLAIGDVSGNGHLDVVASSWVNYWDDPKRQSLIWFENDGKQNFQPRPISGNIKGLVPIELVDMTGNGRLDIITGAFRMDILNPKISGWDVDEQAGRHQRLLMFTQEYDAP
ncbi:FG-GAP-like repeat-containing protein [Marinimicrobium sp. ABcell2]|uniref:FG-GAP-like repeat-containing protein n=1 Tax=Marinimicrobium sp. ABcell2 TaxID=3069751 RepID=UPI0027B00002|nr:FG-GAP-like repeat-containing protein [Marinimicrobium sp. ABcell2]MDQ2075823.1 FG-GAP-like repeat-containing protein [Marinimicrobium sp. ABcell2]